MSSGAASYIVCAVYRPGSATVSATFFVDLVDVLDRLATFVEPLFVVGDLNVHLERPASAVHHPFSSSTCLLTMVCRVALPRQLTTSVVCSILLHPAMIYRRHLLKSSDHRLVRWSVSISRPPPDYTTTVVRPWRQLDADAFCDGLLSSMLCQSDMWKNYDVESCTPLRHREQRRA